MPTKYAKEKLDAIKSKIRQWTFEVSGTYIPNGISSFFGKIKDEKGQVVMIIKEDEEFNQLSRLLGTSKYMKKPNDMRGLAEYVFDRNLIPMTEEERNHWKSKKNFPIDIKYVIVS
jgi:hypothetical protein